MSGPVVVTGASGTIGGHLARQLLAGGTPVRVVSRSPDRVRELASAGAQVVQAGYGDAGLVDAFRDAQGAFLMVPVHRDMVAMGRALHRAAAEAGVPRAVHLSVFTPILEYDAFLGRSHGALDRDFLERFPRGGAILRPEGFMENLMAMAGTIREGQLFSVGDDASTAFIAGSDVAACAAGLLTGDEAPDGVHDLTGPASLTWGQVADAMGEALDREVTFVDIPLDAYMTEVKTMGLPPVLLDVIESLARFRLDEPATRPTDGVQRLTGRPPVAVEAWIRAHAPVFGARA